MHFPKGEIIMKKQQNSPKSGVQVSPHFTVMSPASKPLQGLCSALHNAMMKALAGDMRHLAIM